MAFGVNIYIPPLPGLMPLGKRLNSSVNMNSRKSVVGGEIKKVKRVQPNTSPEVTAIIMLKSVMSRPPAPGSIHCDKVIQPTLYSKQ